MKARFVIILVSLLPISVTLGAGLEWNSAKQDTIPMGWKCGGTGTGTVVTAFADEKHPVVKLESNGDGLVFWNYNYASYYSEQTMVHYRVQFGSRCVGVLGFANDGGGGRGGCGVYFTKEGTFEVADERGARTTLLTDYTAGVWYDVRAYLSTTDDKWDVEVKEVGTGRSAALKSLPWSQPAVQKEKAYAGLGVSVWSPGTVYISEAEIGPTPADVKAKRQSALPVLGIPLAQKTPTLDGTLGKDEWSAAAHITALVTLNTGTLDPKPCDVFACYDASNLYLAFRQPLRSAREVQPSYTKRDDNVFMDDCFEFLISPTRADKDRVHFIGNAAGAIYDDKGGDKKWNGSWTYRTTVSESAWQGEISIPLADIGPPPRDGDGWALNVGRSLLSHDAMLSTTYAVWALPGKAALGFLDLATYGTMQFRGRQPWVALESMAPQTGNQFTAKLVAHNPTDKPVELAARVDDNSAILAPLVEKKISVAAGSSQPFELVTEFPNRWRSTVTLDQSPILLQEALNPFANQPSLAVRPYPLQNVLEVELDLSHLHRSSGAAFLPGLRVQSLDRKKIWIELSLGNVTDKVTKRIPIESLPEGDYLAEVNVLDTKGKSVVVVEKKFIRGEAKPKWFTNPVALEDRVIPPFTPVTVKDRKNNRQVKVWGRTHGFSKSGLPQQIVANDVPLLSAPVQLIVHQSVNDVALDFQNRKRIESKPTRTAWESEAALPDGKFVKLRTTIEFDGMIKLDVTLPCSTALDSFELRAPLRSATHYYTSVLDAYSSEAGRLPKSGFHSSFRPLVWAGDMDRGLFWFSESDRDFQLTDYGRAIEIVDATLRIHWISRPVTLDRERTYTFGLMATPIKPLPVGHETWRVGRDFTFPWWEHYSDALTDPMVHRPDFHEHVKAEHARGCAVLPYFFPTSMNAVARDCLAYKNEWGHPSDLPDVVAEQAMPPDMKMLIDTSWADYFLAGLDKFVRDFGIDGIYYDTTGPMRQSRVDENGVRYTYWPLFACREFHRRTANIFEKHKGSGRYILMSHMSDNMCLPSISFLTVAFDGEQYNRVPFDATDYTKFLPLERAEVINNPTHWGFPVMFLPEIPIRNTPVAHKTNLLATDSLLATILPLANSWWDGPMDYVRQKQVADALLAFDTASASFHPYWRQNEIQAPEGIRVSYYRRGNECLVIVANLTNDSRTADLQFSKSRFKNCDDALGDPAPLFTDGAVKLDIRPLSFRIFKLQS